MDEKWKYKGGDTPAGCLAPGLPVPDDRDLIDWRSLDALGREQARLQALWAKGYLTHRALKAGIWALDRMIQARERLSQDRMAEIEQLLERIQAQVAMRPQPTPTVPTVRPRLLS